MEERGGTDEPGANDRFENNEAYKSEMIHTQSSCLYSRSTMSPCISGTANDTTPLVWFC